MKKVILTILFVVSCLNAQPKDTSLTLQKTEYIGVIKGIKFLESKDSLTNSLIQQLETQIDNYEQLRAQDTLQLHFANTRLKEVVDERIDLTNKLHDCENPPFYKTKTASYILGVLSVVLLSIAL